MFACEFFCFGVVFDELLVWGIPGLLCGFRFVGNLVCLDDFGFII